MSKHARPRLEVTVRGDTCYVSIVGSRGGVRHTYARSETHTDTGKTGLVVAVQECLDTAFPNLGRVEEVNPNQ